MVKKLFLIVSLIFGSYVYAQQSDIKVNPTDFSVSNSGSRESNPVNAKNIGNNAGGVFHEGQMKYPGSKGKMRRTPYKITNSRYVTRSTIRKAVGSANDVRIRIMQNGLDNTDIEDLSLAYNSGSEYRMSNIYGIQNPIFPLYVKVTYRSWNVFHSVQFDVTYEFTLYSRGTWDVNISN
jgi:hypothetical protein